MADAGDFIGVSRPSAAAPEGEELSLRRSSSAKAEKAKSGGKRRKRQQNGSSPSSHLSHTHNHTLVHFAVAACKDGLLLVWLSVKPAEENQTRGWKHHHTHTHHTHTHTHTHTQS